MLAVLVALAACSDNSATKPTTTPVVPKIVDARPIDAAPDAAIDAAIDAPPDAPAKKLKVLYLEGGLLKEGSALISLTSALQREGFEVVGRGPIGVPTKSTDLAEFDFVVLDDVPDHLVTIAQMKSLDAYVREGGGLLVANPNQGYAGTYLESMLPIRIDAENAKTSKATIAVLLPDLVAGTDVEHAPRLEAISHTKAKPLSFIMLSASESSDPVLVRWRRDKGWVVAFTASMRAVEWRAWDGYGKFWATIIRSSARR